MKLVYLKNIIILWLTLDIKPKFNIRLIFKIRPIANITLLAFRIQLEVLNILMLKTLNYQ